jgi:NAD(P)-dependent dehydrogenase (short-subunit alcohol dehydrogenase family)
MHGSVVLITGALSGIGRAMALARWRNSVVVVGHRDDDGHKLTTEPQTPKVYVAFARTDVRREDEVRNLREPPGSSANIPRHASRRPSKRSTFQAKGCHE